MLNYTSDDIHTRLVKEVIGEAILMLEGYNQTFSTLNANTGSNGIQKVYWSSDRGITYGGEPVSCVNSASYTDNGIAHTVLSVWGVMITDTITVYAGYHDDCDIEHVDSIKVIVEDEI